MYTRMADTWAGKVDNAFRYPTLDTKVSPAPDRELYHIESVEHFGSNVVAYVGWLLRAL